ncbi:MAG: hypothetical protein J5662_01275 [Clostridia bacterium]|nr:hypothetical protein [Clostridia bacterium]
MVIDDIITYLQNKISNDEIFKDAKVLETYTYGHKVKSTEVQVMFTEHSEFERFTTFDGIEASVCPLLINIYATQTTYEQTVNEETVTVTLSAQRASYLLAQKIVGWLDSATLASNINDVLSATKARFLPGVPFDVGTLLYQSVVRANLHVKNI